jgi:anthranilate/para-aminobenzoate synthase component I
VEDIVDTGLTMSFLVDLLKERNPRSIRVCALLDKRKRRKVPFKADYVGFVIDDSFVVGYGLDFNEEARSLPDICVIKEGKQGDIYQANLSQRLCVQMNTDPYFLYKKLRQINPSPFHACLTAGGSIS